MSFVVVATTTLYTCMYKYMYREMGVFALDRHELMHVPLFWEISVIVVLIFPSFLLMAKGCFDILLFYQLKLCHIRCKTHKFLFKMHTPFSIYIYIIIYQNYIYYICIDFLFITKQTMTRFCLFKTKYH